MKRSPQSAQSKHGTECTNMRRQGRHSRAMRMGAAFLVILLLAVPLSGWAESAAGKVLYVTNPQPTNRLNMRSQPSLDSEAIGKFYNGTVVEVLDESGEFYHVRINDMVGYMQGTFLSDSRQMPELGLWGAAILATPTEKVHLRAETYEGAISLGLFYTGTTVQVIEEVEEHFKVRTLDLDGYMKKEFLQIDGTPGKQDLVQLTQGRLKKDCALYAFPDTEANSMSYHYAGETVKILATAGVWYYVEVGQEDSSAWAQQRGFMPARAMEIGCYADGVDVGGLTFAAISNPDDATRLHLRKEPSWSSESLGMFLNAAQVQVLDSVSEDEPMPLWVHVTIGGLNGFMQGEFLNVVHKQKLEPMVVEGAVPLEEGTVTVTDSGAEATAAPTNAPAVITLGGSGEDTSGEVAGDEAEGLPEDPDAHG